MTTGNERWNGRPHPSRGARRPLPGGRGVFRREGGVESGAFLIDRIGLKRAFSTIGCGFGAARLYAWVRSVKNYFCWKRGARNFGRGLRVWGIVAVVHSVWVALRMGRHKAEQLTPELICHSRGSGILA